MARTCCGREVDPDYPYSGYLMMNMLLYLDGHDIPIMRSALDVRRTVAAPPMRPS